jgi:hypothetical protein
MLDMASARPRMFGMSLRNILIAVTLATFSGHRGLAQSTPCRDAAEESHHRVLLESSGLRVLLLELPRIESTDSFCYASSYVYVVLSEGRSSITAEGKGTFSRDWGGSETQLIYEPQKQVIRNESGRPFREVIVELARVEPYDPLRDSLTSDMFPSDLGTVKPTWTVSFTRGGVKFSKVQLGAGDTFSVGGGGNLLIALTDVRLRNTQAGASEFLEVQAQDVTILGSSTASRLTNEGRAPARFILIGY